MNTPTVRLSMSFTLSGMPFNFDHEADTCLTQQAWGALSLAEQNEIADRLMADWIFSDGMSERSWGVAEDE